MQYQHSQMAVSGEGVQYEDRVCSTKIVTSQFKVRVFNMRGRSAVPR